MAGADAPIEGVLPIDKPAGPTSHDMVARARRALGTRRIGHTGTLDPFASGLLLLCVGRATRIAEYLSGMDKRYSAVVQLGVATDTEDATGSVLRQHDTAAVTREAVDRALDAQRGSILQTPPAYSAKKVGGERSYALARQGRAVALDPVPVIIHELVVTAFAPPEVHLDVTCSSGTYIRSIARDLGAALGVGAHLGALRRIAIGPHTIEEAIPAEALNVASDATRIPSEVVRAAMIPTLDALGAMPRIDVSEAELADIRHGRAITGSADVSGTVALAANDELIAIADAGENHIRPRKVFL